VADDVELFEELAAERLGMSFVGMNFPARKFPMAGQVRAIGSQRQQKRTIVFDDRRDNYHRVWPVCVICVICGH
jgi:hypothetical protein